ncbi:MAG: hypothetical protein JWR10_4880 [Rubritepida sp.]|nr:hypothetical protein [Rubritepida sp.]
MRFISTRTHGVLDYLTGAVFLISPWLFGFADWTSAQVVPMLVGGGIILVGLLTAYEFGLVHVFSMKTHLTIDVITGALLVASPWLFGFADRVWIPHVVLGLFEVVTTLMTRTEAGRVPTATPMHGR